MNSTHFSTIRAESERSWPYSLSTFSLSLLTFSWIYLLAVYLVFAGAAQVSILAGLIALALASLLFVLPFFGRTDSLVVRLVLAAVSMGVLITAFYAPVSGFFMGLEGGVRTLFVRTQLGIRSSFVAAWLFVALVATAIVNKGQGARRSCVLLFVVFAYGLVVGQGRFEPKMTYLLNSFAPLFAAVAMIPWIMRRSSDFAGYSLILERAAILIIFVCVLYFPILYAFPDVFRPDLALYHQSSFRQESAGASSPGQWGTLLFGYRIPRFVGTFPNPILFGYFSAVVSFAFYVRRHFFLSLVMAVLVLVSLSKGALLLLLSSHLLFLMLKRGRWLFVCATLVLICLELTVAYYLDGSNRVHLRGLQGGLQSVLGGGITTLILGFGLGSGGNFARGQLEGGVYSAGWLASGSESGIGVLTYQLGFLGLGVLLYFGYRIFRYSTTPPEPRDTLSSRTKYAVLALCVSWFSNMLLQEDLVNVTVVTIMLFGVILIVSRDSLSTNSMKLAK